MPSRRKCAHTTKIERVPSYDVYHGEEDLDERLSSEGTLDLSMKKIKMEPPDEELDLSTGVGEDMGERSENDLGNSNDRGAKSDNISSMGEEERSSQDNAPPSDESETDRQTGADDKSASKQGNHSSKQSSAGEGNADEQIVIDSNGQPLSPVTGLPLFLQTSKGKSVRPFKLCTSNRDLLSGLSTQGAPSLATYSVPVALAAVPGAVPLAFASLPLVSGVPMIPGTSPPITSATSSIASTGAGSRTSCTSSTSSTTTTVGAKTTSSSTTDVHLMTLATEADKILRERHASEESSTGASSDMEGNMTGNYSSSGGEEAAMLAGEVLKIPSLAGKTGSMDMDSLTFIQKRAVEAAQSAAHPPKNKKKRMTLPETLKDIAYWERRRKNNEAAKRSRDARRAKEDQIAIRAALLEQENIRLKIEVTALKEETVKLRSMLYANNNS